MHYCSFVRRNHIQKADSLHKGSVSTFSSQKTQHCGLIVHIMPSSWWRHQMEIFSALLAVCVGNSPVTGEFPSQRPMAQSFDVFFDLRLKRRLSKYEESICCWFETPSRSLWRHCNVHDFFLSVAVRSWPRGRRVLWFCIPQTTYVNVDWVVLLWSHRNAGSDCTKLAPRSGKLTLFLILWRVTRFV